MVDHVLTRSSIAVANLVFNVEYNIQTVSTRSNLRLSRRVSEMRQPVSLVGPRTGPTGAFKEHRPLIKVNRYRACFCQATYGAINHAGDSWTVGSNSTAVHRRAWRHALIIERNQLFSPATQHLSDC